MTLDTKPETVEEEIESTQVEGASDEAAVDDAPAETVAEAASSEEAEAEDSDAEAEAAKAEPEEANSAQPATMASITLDDVKTKQRIKGVVQSVELQGAVVNIGLERGALLHISQLSEEPVKNVTDVVNVGDEIEPFVLAVDRKSGRVDLTLMELPDLTWNEVKVNDVVSGEVERIEKYGVFINIGAERPALIHVSELTTGFVDDPENIVKMGDILEAKIIGVNKRKKQIDLSVRALEMAEIEAIQEEEDDSEQLTAMEIAMRKAMEASDQEDEKPRGKRRKKDKSRYERDDDIYTRTLKLRDSEEF